jgi:hypothetical protein
MFYRFIDDVAERYKIISEQKSEVECVYISSYF